MHSKITVMNYLCIPAKQLFLTLIICIISSFFLVAQNRKDNFSSDILNIYLLRFGENTSAALALLPTSTFSATFRNQFLLKELMEKKIYCSYRYRHHLFVVRAYHFGYSKYGEMRISTAYGHAFANKFAVAMQFHYLLNHAHEYSSMHSFTFDVAFQAKIKESFGVGVEVYNPAGLKYEVTGNRVIPGYFAVNMYYKMNSKILLWSKAEKHFPGDVDLIVGMDCRILPIALSGSVSLSRFNFNILLSWRSFIFDLQTQYHYRLGFSPALYLYYHF